MGTELQCYQQLLESREDNFYFKEKFLVSVLALAAFLTMKLFSIRDINRYKFQKYAAAEVRLIVLTAIQFQSQAAVQPACYTPLQTLHSVCLLTPLCQDFSNTSSQFQRTFNGAAGETTKNFKPEDFTTIWGFFPLFSSLPGRAASTEQKKFQNTFVKKR